MGQDEVSKVSFQRSVRKQTEQIVVTLEVVSPRATIPLPMLQMFMSVVQRHWRVFLSLEAGACDARYVQWIDAI